ncbi:hypothetical protein LCGC14_3030100, partial [marine sediment metagenome]
GLSRGNIDNLLAGRPIHKVKVPGYDGELIIMFGETEAVLADAARALSPEADA